MAARKPYNYPLIPPYMQQLNTGRPIPDWAQAWHTPIVDKVVRNSIPIDRDLLARVQAVLPAAQEHYFAQDESMQTKYYTHAGVQITLAITTPAHGESSYVLLATGIYGALRQFANDHGLPIEPSCSYPHVLSNGYEGLHGKLRR
jgi:hypothetical protein